MSSLTAALRALQQKCEEMGVQPELSLSYAWQLLEAATKKTKSQLSVEKNINLSTEQEYWLQQALNRLSACEPLQYIIGEVSFLNCLIKVCPPLLIPRVETEDWVAKLIEYLREHAIQVQRILDIGTGSGCIALALAKEFPHAEVVGVDINPQAIDVAQKNAQLNSITNVQFVVSDVYDQLEDIKFDIIVSNPPYVRESDWQNLDDSVQQWEDKNAIVAHDDGLAVIKRIIRGATTWLRPHGRVWIEIDVHQGELVKQLFIDAGFVDVAVIQDMHGRDRVVRGSYDPH